MTPSTCEQLSSELVAFLDGELGENERRPIATHVSTCLVCRRELERLTMVQRFVASVSPIEPSPEFAARFWRRMEAEPVAAGPTIRSSRPLWWALPALAAAAVLAVALRSMTTAPSEPAGQANRDGLVPHAPAPAEKAKVAAAPAPKEETRQLANVDDIRPEDLPPELLAHPELFLRLPVVRRLETLEHFDAVRQEHGDEDGAG